MGVIYMLVIVVDEGMVSTVYQCKDGKHALIARNLDYEVLYVEHSTDWLKPKLYDPNEENEGE
jgi:hypothetical protein